MRSEEWWRRALALLLYRQVSSITIPFYIARRFLGNGWSPVSRDTIRIKVIYVYAENSIPITLYNPL